MLDPEDPSRPAHLRDADGGNLSVDSVAGKVDVGTRTVSREGTASRSTHPFIAGRRGTLTVDRDSSHSLGISVFLSTAHAINTVIEGETIAS